ncbi:MAG: alkyl hydroperoxide reductase [Hormoscilla sp. SP5CHS1]|nr:alkyl hydroperoxide reductase [Hormoscilla sp. SP12CHS1]MBC6453731.1 alkyl hydroperoxide reductase [Hormoscilla sp. SP5CHS1]MBC6475823.1 alkyl hydroperoxide reductase [Hormoscilla sp. GM102CHS1]
MDIDCHCEGGTNTIKLWEAATYVIAPDRTIVYAFVDADYTKRQDPAEIVEILKTMKFAA